MTKQAPSQRQAEPVAQVQRRLFPVLEPRGGEGRLAVCERPRRASLYDNHYQTIERLAEKRWFIMG